MLAVKHSDMLSQPFLINRAYLLQQNNRVFAKTLKIFNGGMRGQLCLCAYSACYGGDNDRRAVLVACIIGNDKYRACPALLRADNRI